MIIDKSVTLIKIIAVIIALPVLFIYFALRGGDIGLERNWS